jgi:GMP synthase (glutamine-hydrolysing)
MIRLLKHRKKRLIDNKSFENENKLNEHIDLIAKEDLITNDNSRTLELKNWLDYIKKY